MASVGTASLVFGSDRFVPDSPRKPVLPTKTRVSETLTALLSEMPVPVVPWMAPPVQEAAAWATRSWSKA